MFDRDAAQTIAQRNISENATIDDAGIRELKHGWYFPCQYSGATKFEAAFLGAGDGGVIINKHSGKPFHRGTAFELERDLEVYDQGYHYAAYDLVVLKIYDLGRTLDILCAIGITIAEPEYSSGTVWRIPRQVTRGEIQSALQSLPCVFGRVGLFYHAELLQKASREKHFDFKALEYRRPRTD